MSFQETGFVEWWYFGNAARVTLILQLPYGSDCPPYRSSICPSFGPYFTPHSTGTSLFAVLLAANEKGRDKIHMELHNWFL